MNVTPVYVCIYPGGSVGGVAMPVGSKVVLESPGSSEQNEEEESPDLDVDYLEDYDSDEEKRPHRRKKRVRLNSHHKYHVVARQLCHS